MNKKEPQSNHEEKQIAQISSILNQNRHQNCVRTDRMFAILMLAATLTVVSNLIADLLYAWADPRVQFSRK